MALFTLAEVRRRTLTLEDRMLRGSVLTYEGILLDAEALLGRAITNEFYGRSTDRLEELISELRRQLAH